MTAPREVVQQALDVLNEVTGWQSLAPQRVMDEVENTIAALRAALEQTEPLVSMSEMNRTVAYCAASKLRELGYDWDGKIWASLEQPERAQRMREAGYIRRPTLREMAEEEQPEQEPVASIYVTIGGDREFDDWRCPLPVGTNLLYTHPPRREWRGLTDADYDLICDNHSTLQGAGRAIEAKLKELNNE